jgi:hypothetical protein
MVNKGAVPADNAAFDEQSPKHKGNISRRTFLRTSAAIGGGLLLTVALPAGRFAEAASTLPEDFAPNAFDRAVAEPTIDLLLHQYFVPPFLCQRDAAS